MQDKKIFALYCIIFCSLALSICKEKGCTNPAAINYSSIADEDDGSCIICKSSQTEIGSGSCNLVDFNSGGPHWNDVVAAFTISQRSVVYNNSACGSGECVFYLSVHSLVPENMDINFHIQCSGNVFFNFNGFVTVNGNQTTASVQINTTSVSNPCGLFNSGSLFVSSNLDIVYH